MFDQLKRAFGGDAEQRRANLEAEFARVSAAIEARRETLETLRRNRLHALFPDGAVAGSSGGHYPDLDPINFEEGEQDSWLVSVSTQIIDRFPGGDVLLSQLDRSLRAFSDANHFRVVPGGPYAELLGWRDELLGACDLKAEIPLYLRADGLGAEVVGNAAPFVVLQRGVLDALDPDARRYYLATFLGHVFFGNLRIFSFHRLMSILDKLPSMSGLITRGLGMLPGIGNTISRGFEIARTVNNQLIRRTNLVVGMRQKVICDRLAVLLLEDAEPARRFLTQLAYGSTAGPEVYSLICAQGERLNQQLVNNEIDLHMLSVIGPTAQFAAWRAFQLEEFLEGDTYPRIREGHYVTRARLRDYRQAHKTLEDEINRLVARIAELSQRQAKLAAQLASGDAPEEGELPEQP
ncbi:MAG: hypothetical protein KDD82_12535 [Planctomycetes bacterium]|nr:hypothetical protein [Planctomycetota bacterium]